MKKSITLIFISLYLSVIPANAKHTQEEFNLICASMFGPILQNTYNEKNQFITPVFDVETDTTLLKTYEKLAKGEENASSEITQTAVPIFQTKMKNEWDNCISLMKMKNEICGENFIKQDCDPTFSKRPDSKALFITFTDQIKAKFARVKPAEAIASTEEMNANSTSQNIRKTNIYIALSWLFVIAFLAFVILRPRKKCPSCNHDLPKFRVPNDLYELIAGGWTCQNCGTKLTYKLKIRK